MSVITGTSGNDSGGIYNDSASTTADLFFMGQGGNDTVIGGSGNDLFKYDAALTSADSINGGSGYDTVTLNGDYSGAKAVVFAATTIHNIDEIDFAAGHSYQITTNAASVANTFLLKVDGSTLGASDSLIFDASPTANAYFDMRGGAGNDVLTGSTLGDSFDLSTGGNDHASGGTGTNTYYFGAQFNAQDSITGTGNDVLELNGDYSAGVAISSAQITGLSEVIVTPNNSYNLTFGSGAIGGDDTIVIDATGFAQGDKLTFHGASQDQAGFDFLFGGTFSAADRLVGAGDKDNDLILNGDYSSGLVFGAATLKNISVILLDGDKNYKITTNDANISAGKTLTVTAELFSSSDSVIFNGAAEKNGTFLFVASQGEFNLTGGAKDDLFDLGNSTSGQVVAKGSGGNDTFDFTGASGVFSADDKLNGGSGTDTLSINGTGGADYTLSATTLTSIEDIKLNNETYGLTLSDGNVAAGQTLTIDASAMTAGTDLYFSGQDVTSGSLHVIGGHGGALIVGGGGADIFDFSHGATDDVRGNGGSDTFKAGANLDASDSVSGGAGSDTLDLNGDYSSTLSFSSSTVRGVETIKLEKGFNYDLRLNDGNLASGQTMTIDGRANDASHRIDFDGGLESNGHFSITGGAGKDSLSGSMVSDTIAGGGGNDTLIGADGADHLTGGAGKDIYFYFAASNSIGTGYDTITGMDFANADRIGLGFKPKAVDAAITQGTLREAHFDTDLASVIGNHLGKSSALLFTASAGTDKGETFLVVDMNGQAGYQAGEDLVVHLDHAVHTSSFGLSDFVQLV